MSKAGYFHQEISILQEISHPRIVKCIKVIEDSIPNSSYAPYCMALEYCHGPTVERMLNYGGELGVGNMSLLEPICNVITIMIQSSVD